MLKAIFQLDCVEPIKIDDLIRLLQESKKHTDVILMVPDDHVKSIYFCKDE